MSERGLEFLEGWIDRHVLAPALYTVDEAMRNTLAQNCISDAEKEGISLKEIEDEVGNLVKFMADMLEHEREAPQTDRGSETPALE